MWTIRWSVAALMVMAGGCAIGRPAPRPLTAESFVRNRPAVGFDSIGQPVDQSGPLVFNDARGTAVPRDDSRGNLEISKTVRDSVESNGGATTQPATAPSSTRPADLAGTGQTDAAHGLGTYQAVDSVLAEVNGTPIYADRVLAYLERPLQVEARNGDERHFYDVARQMINDRVMNVIDNELEVTQARKSLEHADEQQAWAAARVFRTQKITEAGGSVEEAKRRALEQGTTFDEMVEDHFRTLLIALFYQKHVIPKIQINASDIHRYYEQHLDDEFTEHAEARFRVIQIDVAKSGGSRQALDKIQRLHQRIRAGEDFAAVAGEVNDDPTLLRSKGELPWMQPGNYREEKVEKAVWALHPGEVTDIIDAGNAFYLAQLVERKPGRVKAFEEGKVQEKIRETLRSKQFNELRKKTRATLIKEAFVIPNPQGIEIALDMAMQRYPRWAAAGR